MTLVMVGWKSSFMASCVSRSIPWDDHFTMLMLKHAEDGETAQWRPRYFPSYGIVMSYVLSLTSFYLQTHRFVTFPSEISTFYLKRKHGEAHLLLLRAASTL